VKDLLRIAVNLSQLDAVIDVEPAALQRIHQGQEAVVVIGESGGESFPGTVREIRKGQVVVGFASPSPAVRPGLTAQVRLRLT
jgi:hypothetical protein